MKTGTLQAYSKTVFTFATRAYRATRNATLEPLWEYMQTTEAAEAVFRLILTGLNMRIFDVKKIPEKALYKMVY
jgi:hypothetical protein